MPVALDELQECLTVLVDTQRIVDQIALTEQLSGSYLNDSGCLTVNVVAGKTNGPEDKELYVQIKSWAGSESVVFSNVKCALGFLRDLQKKVEVLPELRVLSSWDCGVNETTGQVELTVPQADEALLKKLAKLDPEDDAILVLGGEIADPGREE